MTPSAVPVLYSRLTSDMTTGGDALPLHRLGASDAVLAQTDVSLNARLWGLYAVDSAAGELRELAVVSFLIHKPQVDTRVPC